jgi:hypothetical protein
LAFAITAVLLAQSARANGRRPKSNTHVRNVDFASGVIGESENYAGTLLHMTTGGLSIPTRDLHDFAVAVFDLFAVVAKPRGN